MAITVADLKFFKSERMTDYDDGGGRMTGNAIISGVENEIFDDVSDVDRAAGDVSIRKVYAAVTSANTDKYLDAGVVIFKEPDDAAASVLALSTGSFYDEREDIKNRIENTITRGARWNGWLWGQHLIGQRAVVLWQRPTDEVPATGERLELVQMASGVQHHNQFLWITRVTETVRTRNDDNGAYSIREVVCEIAEPLEADYLGVEPSRYDPQVGANSALVYGTRYNANAVALFGIKPLVTQADVGDFSCTIPTLYEYIIPTSLLEVGLTDVNPGGDTPALIPGGSTPVTFTTTADVVKPNVGMYLGTGARPGTINVQYGASLITDDNGTMKLASVDIGSVDYGNGILSWNSECPSWGNGNKTVTFAPASRPTRVADTAAIVVTASNRGYVWTITLSPIPARQTLRISYRVNGKWYVLNDLGNGLLQGVDSSYGSAILSFDTGTVLLTTGEIPDVDSEIIFTWGTTVNYTARGGSSTDAPFVVGQTANIGLRPAHTSVSWLLGGSTRTLTDGAGDGTLTGSDGVGFVDYWTGAWWVRPNVLPAVGTEFTISYQYGTAGTPSDIVTDVINDPVILGDTYTYTLSNLNIEPGTLRVYYEISYEYLEGLGYSYTHGKDITDSDDGAGSLVVLGGTVNYAAGTVEWTPLLNMTDNFSVPVYVVNEAEWIDGLFVGRSGTSQYLFNGFITVTLDPSYISANVRFEYRLDTGSWTTVSGETVALTQLAIDLTRGYSETITSSSVRFRIGTDVYAERANRIYLNPSPATGAGALAGTLDSSSGRCLINAWTEGVANSVVIDSLVTEIGTHHIGLAVFRTVSCPLRAGTFQIRYTTTGGDTISKTVDDTGRLEDADCTLIVDHLMGVVRARFGLWRTVASLTPEELLEDWYDVELITDRGGVPSIWKPKMVIASSLIYNAVVQTTLPPDSTLLGINAARLPPDGKGLIFNPGRLSLVHHTGTVTETTLSPSQVIDCGRIRLYRVAIDDTDDKRLPDSFFTVDRMLGLVTMSPSLDLTGYSGPYTIRHTVADLARLVATDINGTLSFNKALSHTFPVPGSKVSGVLFAGTLQARYTNLFAQATWTSEWSDELIGDTPLAQYNDALYPIIVANLGAYTDRILVRFTSSTAYQVIGENLGLIGTGTINADCAPVNSLTAQPYFTIDYRGWGGGWATGNCLRFNVIGASYPVDLIRAVQPSSPTGEDVSTVELLFIGNEDA